MVGWEKSLAEEQAGRTARSPHLQRDEEAMQFLLVANYRKEL